MSVTINSKGTSVSSFTVGKNGLLILASGELTPPAGNDLIINLDPGNSIIIDSGSMDPGLISMTDGRNLNIDPAAQGGGNLIIVGSQWPADTGLSGQVLTTDGAGILTWEDTASVPVNAANLIGTTLASNVVNSSLTSVGTLTSLTLASPLTTGNGGTGLNSPGTSGNVLTSNGTSWVSSPPTGGGTSSWSVKTTAYTAVDGDLLYCNTTSAAFTITLPATPTTGNNVRIKSGPAAATNNLTIGRNGSTIMGLTEDMVISLNNTDTTIIYDGSTWRI